MKQTLNVIYVNTVAAMNQTEANSQQRLDTRVALLAILETAEVTLVYVSEVSNLIASGIGLFQELTEYLSKKSSSTSTVFMTMIPVAKEEKLKKGSYCSPDFHS